MATTVTVPGASGSQIPNPYNTTYNLAVAQQISSMLADAQGSSTLVITDSDQNAEVILPGQVGEVAVTLPGASVVNLPQGYSYTALDQSVTGPVTINGGGSLFAGNQQITYNGAAGSDTAYIAAGDGNDLFNMPAGSNYVMGLGNGNDTVYADGSGSIAGGSGRNFFDIGGPPGSNNVVSSNGDQDTIIAGAGNVSVNTTGTDPSVVGGTGNLVYLGSAAGDPTITGATGTGHETLFGGAGQDITYQDNPAGAASPGSAIFGAGAGNETLNAGGSSTGVQLAAGVGSVDMIGSTGPDTFYGGDGYATMTGNGGDNVFEFAMANGTLQGGGTNIITDFNVQNDDFILVGYGATGAQDALKGATVSGGNTFVKLSDGTSIEFVSVIAPALIRSQSFTS
jgi:Ca2+-binding RTX toxin-like protein